MRGRGKSRVKEELEQLALAELFCFLICHQAGLNRGAAHPVKINAAAVIFHLDKNMAAARIGAYRQFSAFAFAREVALFPAFHTVRHRVANQVNQRIGNLLDDIVVKFGLGPGKGKLHLLAAGFGGVAGRARKPCIQIADGNHARPGNLILQTAGKLGEAVDIAIHAAREPVNLHQHLADVGRDLAQRVGEQAELIVAVELQLTELG